MENKKEIRRGISEHGMQLIQKFYAGAIDKSSPEFKCLLDELKYIWGLRFCDNSEDDMVIESLNIKKEIKSLARDYDLVDRFYLVEILDSYHMERDKDNYLKHIANITESKLGKRIYQYILDHPSENFIFKILKERYIDYSMSYANVRQEKTSCYVFKKKDKAA